jgi:hypothetical protein
MKNDIPHGGLDIGEDDFADSWPVLNSAGWFWLCYFATIAAFGAFAVVVFW